MKFKCTTLLIILLAVISGCAKNRGSYQPTEKVLGKTYVHKYGVTVKPDDWSSRGKHGKVISTLESGVVVTNNYSSGILQGESTYTFPHSETISKVETYENGNLAKETNFYHSGTPKQEIQYQGGNERTITIWYETGSPERVETYRGDKLVKADYYTPANILDSQVVEGRGVRVNRDSYGQLLSHEEIERGVFVKCTTFHPNGTPSEIVPYHLGAVQGERMTFYPGGEPRTVEEWNSGKQNGITLVFQNGEKIADVPYKNGGKCGIERRYRAGEFVVEEIAWVDNHKHGPSKTYIGDVVKTDWYFHGQKVTKPNYEKLHDLNK